MTLLSPERTLLCEDLLAACGTRAATYDRENRFFTEDVAALRDAGHLRLAVSPEPGGFGRNLADVCADQRRLGDWAAPTVLGVNMHLINTGVVTDVGRFGDTTQEWLLKGSGRVRAGPFPSGRPAGRRGHRHERRSGS